MRLVIITAVAAFALIPHQVFANETKNQSESVTVQPINQEDFRLTDLAEGDEKFAAESTLLLSGEMAVWNKFVDHDLFEQIPGAVADTQLTVQLTEEFGLTLWSMQALDIDAPRTGNELYVAAFYQTEVADELTLQLEVGRSFTRGFNDIWLFTAGVTYQDFDLSATQFVVDAGPLRGPGDAEDATRIQFGYTPQLIDGVVNRVFLTHETGFGLPDITTIGLEVEIPVSSQWSLRGEVIAPLIKKSFDDRSTAFMVGVSYSF